MKYYFSPEAKFEIKESEDFYNNEQPGLGKEFLEEVRHAARAIAQNPEVWQKTYKDFRRYFLSRFPFHLIYRIHPDAVEVTAVSHNKRRPDYWKKRL